MKKKILKIGIVALGLCISFSAFASFNVYVSNLGCPDAPLKFETTDDHLLIPPAFTVSALERDYGVTIDDS